MSGETKDMFPEGTTATQNGFYSPAGELLRGVGLSQEEVNAWNGVKKKKAKPAKSTITEKSSKSDMEAEGRKHGIELDKRKGKKTLWNQLKNVLK
jgi:hypothetical protein|tara:strand:+ start:1613 stop:1897 length:285 start_codon:yes stop_codon:yes gene_type:complete